MSPLQYLKYLNHLNLVLDRPDGTYQSDGTLTSKTGQNQHFSFLFRLW